MTASMDTPGKQPGSQVTVVGELTFDFLGTSGQAFPSDCRTMELDSLAWSNGGRAGNCAVMLNSLGAQVKLVSCVGDDFCGSSYERELGARGIDDSGILRDPESFTTRVILIDGGDGCRAFVHQDRDAAFLERFMDWAARIARDDGGSILYCTSQHPMVNLAALEARSVGGRLGMFSPGHDTSSYSPENLAACLSAADILVLNEVEANIAEQLLSLDILNFGDRFNLHAAIVTAGVGGSVCFERSGRTQVPALPVRSVANAAGAGDGFTAGVILGLERGLDIVEAARLGAGVAAFIVETVGTRSDALSADAVAQRAGLSLD